MLVIKYTTSIFLLMSTSLPSPYNLHQDICYVKLEVIIFKCNLLHIYWGTSAAYIHELPTKYPRVKILDPRNTHEKKFGTHEGPVARWHPRLHKTQGV